MRHAGIDAVEFVDAKPVGDAFGHSGWTELFLQADNINVGDPKCLGRPEARGYVVGMMDVLHDQADLSRAVVGRAQQSFAPGFRHRWREQFPRVRRILRRVHSDFPFRTLSGVFVMRHALWLRAGFEVDG